jgi:S1-C subfamily serine protease
MFRVTWLVLIPGQIATITSADFSKAAQRAAVTATVRVVNVTQKVEGSGAVIGRQGKTVYILTARHLVAGADQLEVTTFSAGSYPKPTKIYRNAKVAATSDRLRDLALVELTTDDRLPARLQVCPPLVIPKKRGFPALAVGCTKGAAPTCLVDKVLGKKRVRRKGAPATALMWELKKKQAAGRSGGPLVDKRGYLIGVCSGTNKDKGFYCHTAEIHAFLKKNALAKLLKP